MAHYILVHGAWHGAWCWSKVIELLKSAGHTVDAFDLPGLGDDRTPPQATSLASYADRVVQALDAAEGPAILVGHSMGGLAISQAAESRPEKVRVLVYVTAFLPRDGETLLQIAQGDTDAIVLRNAVIDEAQGLATIPEEKRREIFYGECSDEAALAAAPRLVPQFLGLFQMPARLTEAGHGSVRRVYIECTKDRAITIDAQRRMVAASPCAAVYTLETDHSPFLSRPEELAALLARVE